MLPQNAYLFQSVGTVLHHLDKVRQAVSMFLTDPKRDEIDLHLTAVANIALHYLNRDV